MKKIFKILIKITKRMAIYTIILVAVVSCVIIFGQNYLLIPALLNQYSIDEIQTDLASNIEIYNDAGVLDVWKVPAKKIDKKEIKHKAAVFFIGNGDILPLSLSVQTWLSERGYTVYSFNYRGVAKSSGSFSEDNVKKDAMTLVNYVAENEKVAQQDILVAGYSFGTGVASFVASQIKPKTLLLLAPYTSLREVVRERKTLIKYFWPFLMTNFPSKEYIQNLDDTCVIMAHGKQDKIISYHHSEALKDKYFGKLYLFIDDEAHHLNVLGKLKRQIGEALKVCEKEEN